MANFYFTDRKSNLIDVVSTDGNTDIKIVSIKDIQSIEESARDFEATLYFKDDDFKLAKQLSTVGNFVLYKDREGQSVFISIESREINATDGLVMITGKDASIDLINEVVAPYTPDKSYSISEYILRFTSDSGFEIGENAIPDKKLKLEEWTSEATALERILSVATRFDVELSFSFEISGLDVVKRYINISEKRGKDENVTLYANREIESITLKEDIYDLFTAIKPIGAIPEGKETPINLNSYKYTDPDGRYVLSGGILRDNQVVQEWSRLLSNENPNPTSAHITRYKEYDTEDQAKLFTMAMTDLKKYAQLNVNYDVAFYEFPTTVSIGDTINIVDEDKEIYLSARVLKLTYDYVTDTAEATIGDYLIKESGISQDLENLASSMKDKFANVNENLNGKAVIVKSDTAPEPNENTIWIDTSNPQTPIKTYDPETGEWLVSTGEAGKDGIAGKDGLGVLSTVITYAISASGTTTPSGGWTAQVPTLEKGKYLWTKTQWTYTDGSTENGYTVSYIAKDGNDGEDGYAGKDGVGISNTKVEYVGSTSGTTRPTTGWSTTIPTVAEGNFLWTRTTWTYTDNTSETGYSVAKMGAKGDKGEAGKDGIAGKDGVGVSQTAITYAQSTSGTTAPSTGWSTSVPTLVKGQYLWTRTVWTYTDASTEIGYTVSYNAKDGNNGTDGIAGKDGVGISNTVIEYVGAVSGTSKPTSGWSTTIPTVPAGQYLWTRTTWQYTDGTSEQGFTNALMGRTGASGKDGIAGKDGVGIESTQIMYAQSTSGTTAPITGWTSQVPTLIKGQYLWTQTTWVYTDNTGEAGYTVSYNAKDGNNGTDGIAGKDGVGIKTTTIQYVGSTSGTTKPTSGWTTTIPTVAEGSYLWTKTTWTYTDNTTEVGYSVAKMGAKGDKGDTGAKGADGIAGKDGVGLKETIIRYAGSSNGTTAPTSGWQSTVPVVSAGSFLWTRTTWTYTDNTSEIGYSVSRIGADGNKGNDGIAGKDGVGIISTTITYASSTSGVNAPTSGWTVSIPTVADGNFLWTKTVWSYTDNTSETGYSVAKMGAKGADGKDGIAGKDDVGIKSTTIQYASSTSGTTAPTTGWQTNVPTVSAGNYLWTKNTWTYTDNSTEVGYAVSRIGKDGNTGKDGVAGKDGTGIKATSIQYAGSTSGTTPPTTGWTASVPTVASGSYLWTKTTWSYTDDTNETGYSVSRMGETGAKGDTGDSATSYWVTPSVNAIKISASKVLSPSTVTFTGYAKTGTANTVTYSGRFNVMTSTDGIVYSSVYVSSSNQSTYTYTIPTTAKFIKVRMYLAGGTSVLVDEQTIPILESAEDLEIGGRNLQPDTFNFSSKAFRSLTSSTVVTKESTGSWVEVITGATSTELNFVDIGENQQFTVSFDCMTTNTTINSTQMMLVQYFNSSGTRINYEWVYGSYGNSWKRFSLTSTTPTGTTQIGLGFRSTANSLRYRLVKLELGNKATAWTPALEDAQLYTAWSNKSDGSVDFTRDYPNDNLFVLKTLEGSSSAVGAKVPIFVNSSSGASSSQRMSIVNQTDGGIKITSTVANDPYYRPIANIPSSAVGDVGDVFYISFRYSVKSGNFLRLRLINFTTDNATTYYSGTGTVHLPMTLKSASNVYISFDVTSTQDNTYVVGNEATLYDIKFSKGTALPYTTARQDDPIKAEMAYIGYSPKDSNNPADYVWSENPKAKGTFKRWSNDPNGLVDFTAVYPNENLLRTTTSESTIVGAGQSNQTDARTNYTLLTTPFNTLWVDMKVGDTFIFSCDVTISGTGFAGQFRPQTHMSPYVAMGSYYNVTKAETVRVSFTGVVTQALIDSATVTMVQIRYDNIPTTVSITVSKPKLERGSVATPYTTSKEEDLLLQIPQYIGIGSKDTMNPADFVWTVSPEYTQARTDLGLESKVDDETFNDAQDHMNEQIDSKASADELQALAELTENLKESYEGFISDGGKYEADLQALEARATGLLLDLEDKVLDLDFLKTRMRLGEEGFEIGAEESSMKMLLTNDRLSFMDSGKEIAYFSNQQFKINRGAILESIQIGSHKITKISDKMTVFQFVPPL